MSEPTEPTVILRPTIALSWRPADEFDEVAEVLRLLSNEGDTSAASSIISDHISDPSPDAFLSVLDKLLGRHRGTNTLYLTCHGSDGALHFTDHGPEKPLPYADLLGVLAKFEGKMSGLTLAMGSCCAAEVFKPMLDRLPRFVRRFVGFTQKPSARQAAQMLASVIGSDDKTLFDLISRAAHFHDDVLTQAFRKNDPTSMDAIFQERRQAVETILNEFVAEASRLVTAESDRERRETGYLLDFRRQDDGSWKEVDDI
jgi:hypothetical protein